MIKRKRQIGEYRTEALLYHAKEFDFIIKEIEFHEVFRERINGIR